MRYRGLDERERRSRVRWSRPPDKVDAGRAAFLLRLEPEGNRDDRDERGLRDRCGSSRRRQVRSTRRSTMRCRTRARVVRRRTASCCRVLSSSADVQPLARCARAADLQIMLTDTPHGSYPYAGIPWFSTPFGRDGLITAFELLWVNPAIARGVLAFLAETQATSRERRAGRAAGKDPPRDARRRDGGARRSAVRPLLRQL